MYNETTNKREIKMKNAINLYIVKNMHGNTVNGWNNKCVWYINRIKNNKKYLVSYSKSLMTSLDSTDMNRTSKIDNPNKS